MTTKEYKLRINEFKNWEYFFNNEVPENIDNIKEIQILTTKGIETFEPLQKFKNLETICFGTTNSTMTIKTLKGLENVIGLKYLYFLAKTKIQSDINVISKLKSLISLGLYNINMDLPACLLKNMDSLRRLSLSEKNYLSVKYLPPNLEDLTLGFNSISELPSWNNINSLLTLQIGCQTSNFVSLDSLKIFSNLEKLYLINPKQLNDIGYIKELKKLKELNINGATSITDFSPIANHPSLEVLRIRNTNIEEIKDILPLPKLKMLFAEKTKLKNLAGIKEGLPNIEVLWIWMTKLRNLDSLSDMKTLKDLNISDLKVNQFDFLSTLTDLEKIDLYNTSFTDFDLLNNLANLSYIRYTKDETVPEKYKKLVGHQGWDY